MMFRPGSMSFRVETSEERERETERGRGRGREREREREMIVVSCLGLSLPPLGQATLEATP